eukprot:761550-Hanusia_phi.AAC.14
MIGVDIAPCVPLTTGIPSSRLAPRAAPGQPQADVTEKVTGSEFASPNIRSAGFRFKFGSNQENNDFKRFHWVIADFIRLEPNEIIAGQSSVEIRSCDGGVLLGLQVEIEGWGPVVWLESIAVRVGGGGTRRPLEQRRGGAYKGDMKGWGRQVGVKRRGQERMREHVPRSGRGGEEEERGVCGIESSEDKKRTGTRGRIADLSKKPFDAMLSLLNPIC